MLNKEYWLVDVVFYENESGCKDYTVVCDTFEQATNLMKWFEEGMKAKADKGEILYGLINMENKRSISRIKFWLEYLFGKANFVRCK